ncbi:hypothetical protein ACFVU2_19905 [Leifsonia sp. NPDC058194]|uniref:hypothetical protein n=1 Tax=Leifsonia sp. NPDC058194 TaxID=3346374 RepID=UPI0036D7A573
MGTKDTAKGIAAKLRLDSHHGIERFGAFFAIIAVTAVALFGGASASAIANQQSTMDATTLYVKSFNTSKTQVEGAVDGVYVNSHRTRAMVLWHFKDTSSMSANAAKYRAFLTGSNVSLGEEALKTQVTGQIDVFGSTGYMAMVLDSDQPFPQQVLNLTMRANSELVYRPSDSSKLRDDLKGQKSFLQFDQWRIYFNPGASGAKVTPALDSNTVDPGAIYASLVIAPQEKTIRDTMDGQLAQLQVDQARIAEYQSEAARVNVDGISLVLPKVPDQIAGDVVTGKATVAGAPSTLALKTKWVSPSGFNFDWRSGSVAQGYLDSIVPAGQSYVTFLADKAALSKDASTGTLQPNSLEWKLSNGRLLSDYGTSDAVMQPLIDIRNNLAQAYQDYYTHKVAYQVDSYSTLINLEVALRSVREGASQNEAKKSLFIY